MEGNAEDSKITRLILLRRIRPNANRDSRTAHNPVELIDGAGRLISTTLPAPDRGKPGRGQLKDLLFGR